MDAPDRRRRAVAEAADWLVVLQDEALPRTTRERYVEWLRESPVHVAEILRLAQVHNALQQYSGWPLARASDVDGADSLLEDKIIPLHQVVSPRAQSATDLRRFRRHHWLWAIAATLGTCAAGAWMLVADHSHTIRTELGERRQVALSDGSVVEMDPQSQLRIAFTSKAREVVLDRGRALFKVARQPARPFEVRIDSTRVRALGTAFGIERQGADVRITVAEGHVAVMPSAAPTSGLAADQQVTVHASGAAEKIQSVDSARELAWASGRVIFENEPVASVVERLNRYNHVQIRIVDADLAARRVSGVIDATDPDSFMAFIQTVVPIEVERGDGEDIVSASR